MSYFKENIIYNPDNSNPAFYISCAGETFPDPDYVISREDSSTIIVEYIVSGQGWLETDDKRFELNAGQSLIIPCHKEHKYYSDKDTPYNKIWLNVKGSIAADLLNFYFKGITPIISSCSIEKEIKKCIQLLGQFNINKGRLLQLYCSVLDKMKENLLQKEAYDIKGQSIPEEMQKYISNHIQEAFNIDILSEKFHLAPGYVIRLFKNKYGITPYQYHIKQKIALAEKLLINTDLSIDDICARLNYCNRNHFFLAFKKYNGCSPSEFKKKSKENK